MVMLNETSFSVLLRRSFLLPFNTKNVSAIQICKHSMAYSKINLNKLKNRFQRHWMFQLSIFNLRPKMEITIAQILSCDCVSLSSKTITFIIYFSIRDAITHASFIVFSCKNFNKFTVCIESLERVRDFNFAAHWIFF